MPLLDTDIIIDVQRGFAPAVEWFNNLTELPSVPGLVVMELIQDAQNRRQVAEVQRLVRPFPVVWPTEADCARALTDFSTLHLAHGVGLLDCLIASIAVGLGEPLYTFNARHFFIPSTRATFARFPACSRSRRIRDE